VIGIIVLLASLLTPAFNALSGAGTLTQSASDISSYLEQARSYAMGKNTYVYVGLQEIDVLNAQSASPTITSGVGRVVVATVYSQDGMRPYTNTPGAMTAGILPVGKLRFFDNLHITNASSLTNGANMTSRHMESSLVTDLSTNTSQITFKWTNGANQYTFANVIEFDPQGIPRVQTSTTYSSAIQPYLELPLIQCHGNTAPATIPANQAAIQLNGLTGAVRVYRP